MKMLLVDDDPDLLDLTSYALRRHGYDVLTATDGVQALERFKVESPDLLVLDLGLPKIGGFEVCRKIREDSTVPIIMLTAHGDDDNVVQGFLAGADDYVTKPFSHRQLAARIRVLLNRRAGGVRAEPSGELRVGDLHLDLQSHEVTKGDISVRLTPLEFRILHILAVNENRVVTSARMVEHAWGYDGGESSLLKTHVSHIRHKLKMQRGQPGYIRAIPWVGYSLTR
jgi:DNA-binding response OmpR family regulator